MKFIARLAATLVLVSTAPTFACTDPVSVCTKAAKTSFPLISGGKPAALLIEASADSAVKLASASFANDLQRVSGQRPERPSDRGSADGELIIAGVVGQSPVIDDLARAGKIQVSDLPGRWEAYKQIVVDKPFKNVPRALVIAGSDRRGAVFGLYDLAEKIGVSPWCWFADVPVARQAEIHLTAGV